MASVSEAPVEQVFKEAQQTPVSETLSSSLSSTTAEKLTTTVMPAQVERRHIQPPLTVLTTIYSFPNMEPYRFEYYPSNHLFLPLRRDILHSAIVYEGNKARQGTHSTKWRDEVHGSHKKLHRQKGLGKARVGDKQSPIQRGGGVAFGPKPRDHSTGLNRKVYDLAWRIALSYRYRRGQLFIVDEITNPQTDEPFFMKQIFDAHRWGNKDGRSLLVASKRRGWNKWFFTGVERIGEEGRMLTVDEVDVKNLLEMGRVVIEFEALNALLSRHSSDLVPPVKLRGQRTANNLITTASAL